MGRKVFSIIFACMQICMQAQQVYFVKSDAIGSNNGNSWVDAFTDIQSVLQIAHYGDQIWVAKGTYKPTSNLDRNQSFFLPVGVSILGGFAGTEMSSTQRNILDNLTILSGEIGDQTNRDDNSFHVFVVLGGDSLTIIDGFRIVSGNANGQDDGGIESRGHGGGVLVAADGLNPVAKPVIINCFFENNHGIRGGAIACLGNTEFACVPDIENCSFTHNRAEAYGGSIYKEGINLVNEPFIIKNCLSIKNYCKQIAGGVAIIHPSGIVRLQGCTFTSDTGRLEVGGVYLETGDTKAKYEIDSCFFNSNYSYNGCGGLTQLTYGSFVDTVEIDICNTTFLFNKNTVGAGGGFASYCSAKLQKITLNNCVFSNNFSQNGGGGIWIEGGSSCNTVINTDRCFFLENLTGATSTAGAFYLRGYSSSSLKNISTISNSVFMFNSGAIACVSTIPAIIDTRIVNSSFYRNGPKPFVKYWRADLPATYKSTMKILNSVIWEPEADGIEHVFYNNDPINLTVYDYLIEHSIIHLPSCNYNGVDPCHEGMIYSEWPNFIDSTGQIGLIPWANNPGLNKGSNIVVDTFKILTDFTGVDRIYCDSVDIGAYEITENCNSSINEVILNKVPITISLLQNPVIEGDLVKVEIYSLKTININIKLQDINGRIIWQNNRQLIENIPLGISIPVQNCIPGIYFLSVSGPLGRFHAQKVILD